MGNGNKKDIINIDTLSENFDDGDVVTLKALKQKGLVSKNVGHIKVLARGTLDKCLTVEANAFSLDAVKMIVLVGGKAIKR
jgi:large subunit ribosomal protein L15